MYEPASRIDVGEALNSRFHQMQSEKYYRKALCPGRSLLAPPSEDECNPSGPRTPARDLVKKLIEPHPDIGALAHSLARSPDFPLTFVWLRKKRVPNVSRGHRSREPRSFPLTVKRCPRLPDAAHLRVLAQVDASEVTSVQTVPKPLDRSPAYSYSYVANLAYSNVMFC
ncbi:hypothetical protein JOB18_026265 [Solea senegalensis]|uniref:Uncharacterized protein n=1 Tax=Solea senegalensis TaxID=28829 RepID=A0AAV6RQU5_SOLSE|nr:hypothetical protein JOB18_026265 [Solea senegalensis]